MAATKTEHFTNEQLRLAELFKALAHPARIAIMEFLMRKGECVCGDIVSELPLAQSTVSQHLKVLKEAGLVVGEVDGVYSCYCANKAYCCTVMEQMEAFMKTLSKDGCC